MLELFTVSVYIKDGNPTINVDFNEELTEIVSEEELLEVMHDKFYSLTPIIEDMMKFLSEKM